MIRIAINEPTKCLIVHIEPLIPELWGVEWAKIGEIGGGRLLQTRYRTENVNIIAWYLAIWSPRYLATSSA